VPEIPAGAAKSTDPWTLRVVPEVSTKPPLPPKLPPIALIVGCSARHSVASASFRQARSNSVFRMLDCRLLSPDRWLLSHRRAPSNQTP
jgi:hypothetical protein